LGACGPVAVVAAIRRVAGTGFDRDRETQLDQLFDDLGYRSNTLFARQRFAGNSNCQRHDSPIHMFIYSVIHERLLLSFWFVPDARSDHADIVPRL
jgi:hypothetical protein